MDLDEKLHADIAAILERIGYVRPPKHVHDATARDAHFLTFAEAIAHEIKRDWEFRTRSVGRAKL